MTPDSEGAAVEGDIISNLPSNVVDHILELLLVNDAARTSILSKKWRYIWATCPNLVLNNLFCIKLTAKSQYAFQETVDKILLQHVGDVVKFDLDVSEAHLSSDTDIDRWMRYVTIHGVKELKLNMSNNTIYKLPSCIFNCPTLTYLELNNCVFQQPNSFLGFKNLKTLCLESITFVPTSKLCTINAPLLDKLTLWHCKDTKYLSIVSSGLTFLAVREKHSDLKLNRFINCKTLTSLYLIVDNPRHDNERLNLEKLLFSLPALQILTLGGLELELLSAGTIPKGLPFTLNCPWHLRFSVDFSKVGQISYALELINGSRNLHKLEIWVRTATSGSTEAALKYLDSPDCLDRQPLNKLKHVFIRLFKGSKSELHFVKLLFARSPSLLSMCIMPSKVAETSMEERNNITTELMRFPRASPKAELFYLPNAN